MFKKDKNPIIAGPVMGYPSRQCSYVRAVGSPPTHATRLLAIKLIITVLLFFVFHSPLVVHAQTAEPQKAIEARISRVIEEKEIDFEGKKQLYQRLELISSDNSKTFQLESGTVPLANPIKYQVNDKVLVMAEKDPQGQDVYFITDFVRRTPLLVLFLLFTIVTLLIAKKRGFSALIGLAISFLVILKIILPQILLGRNPVLIAALSSLIIVPATFYLAHGYNKKTTVAVIGTYITLLLTAFLATYFIDNARLSGFASEEAGFLQVAKQGTLNIKGLLLAGIIIGSIGILDDITISQAAVVEKLRETSAKLDPGELYRKAMEVGQDHIASMVNTLVLVYTGAALPLLLLFVNNPHPFSEIINYEIIAEEVVRTLVGSVGLVLAVPITTAIAAWYFSRKTL
jgi:uncharacterized membrane protein